MNVAGSSNGTTPYERLTDTQVDAMAKTLWWFAWAADPNDPGCAEGLKSYDDAGEPAKRHYRVWARSIFLAQERGEPVHGWFDVQARAGVYPGETAASEGTDR